MNSIKNFLSKRNEFLRFLKLSSYIGHPTYNRINPSSRLKQLTLMRDLRLWVIENIPNSFSTGRFYSEIEHLTREMRYIEMKRIYFRGFIYMTFISLLYIRINNTLRQNQLNTWYDVSVLQLATNGASTLHSTETKHPAKRYPVNEDWFKLNIK